MGVPQPTRAFGRVTHIHSTSSWVEGSAIEQARQVAALEGVRRVTTLPDLHPGKHGPVGCTIASDLLRPRLVGSDVGCGMSLFALDLRSRKLRPDKIAERLRRLAEPPGAEVGDLLSKAGLDPAMADGFSTVGGGNHFCEVQSVGSVLDAQAALSLGVERDRALLLVHSGSRSHGHALLAGVQREGDLALAHGTEDADTYMARHDVLVRWASASRAAIAGRAARALGTEVRLLTDVPHNLVLRTTDGMYIHHKGAAVVDMATLRQVPVAGSRGTPTVLVEAVPDLTSTDGAISHGAGRRYDRASMRHRVGQTRSDRDDLARNAFGGRAVCDDRDLLVEEAPAAYKNVERVVRDLEEAGLVRRVATMLPMATYKVARVDGATR